MEAERDIWREGERKIEGGREGGRWRDSWREGGRWRDSWREGGREGGERKIERER